MFSNSNHNRNSVVSDRRGVNQSMKGLLRPILPFNLTWQVLMGEGRDRLSGWERSTQIALEDASEWMRQKYRRSEKDFSCGRS